MTSLLTIVAVACLLATPGCKRGGSADVLLACQQAEPLQRATQCQRACQEKHAEGCRRQGDALQHDYVLHAQAGRAEAATLEHEALEAFEKGCELSDGDACAQASDMLNGLHLRMADPTSDVSVPGFSDREARYARVRELGCALEPRRSCAAAVVALRDVDVARAKAALTRQCAAGPADQHDGCRSQGEKLIDEYVALKRSCADKNPDACERQGRLLLAEVRDPRRYAQDLVMLRRGLDQVVAACRARGHSDDVVRGGAGPLSEPPRLESELGARARDHARCVRRLLAPAASGPAHASPGVGLLPAPDAAVPSELPPPRGRLRVGRVTTTGEVDSAEVQRALEARSSELRRCYALGLERNSALQGRVAVALAIDAMGITAHNAGSDLPDAAVVACVIGVASKLALSTHGTARAPLLLQPD